MNQEQINQALRLTINDLLAQLSEQMTTKNLLAVQLTELQQENDRLYSENKALKKQIENSENEAEEEL